MVENGNWLGSETRGILLTCALLTVPIRHDFSRILQLYRFGDDHGLANGVVVQVDTVSGTIVLGIVWSMNLLVILQNISTHKQDE